MQHLTPPLASGWRSLLAAMVFTGAWVGAAQSPFRQPELPSNAFNTSAVASGTNTATITVTNNMDGLDTAYKLAIGDRLSFRIIEDEEESRPLTVTDSGDIECPYLGRYPAVGKSCKQLATELKAELEKDYYFQATVMIAVDLMTRSRGRIYVIGPVRTPGPQDIPSDETLTVSKAILRAGGFADYADKHGVRITRKSKVPNGSDQTFVIDVAQILEKGKTGTDMVLEPGDFIYVPEKTIRF